MRADVRARLHAVSQRSAETLSRKEAARVVRWRTGRKVGRTIYAQYGPQPSDDDLLIGMMDTSALAAEAVKSHNKNLTV